MIFRSICRRHFLVFWAAALLSACSAGPDFAPAPAPPPGEALIYLYRPWAFLHSAGSPRVQLSDGRWVDLANDSYAVMRVRPGAIQLRVTETVGLLAGERWPGETWINAKAGQIYYVRWHLETAGSDSLNASNLATGFTTEGKFEVVPEGTGRAEIAKTSQVAVQGPAVERR